MDASFVIAARDELLSRIQYMFFQPVYKCFANMWYESQQIAIRKTRQSSPPSGAVRDIFLSRLDTVKNWTATQINDQYASVTQSREGLFELLLNRTFTLCSRILVVAVDIPPAYLTIHIPDNRRFVHAVFINAARAFYRNPWLFLHAHKDGVPYQQIMALEKTVDDTVQRTVRELMNIDNIFNASSTSLPTNIPPPTQPPTLSPFNYNAKDVPEMEFPLPDADDSPAEFISNNFDNDEKEGGNNGEQGGDDIVSDKSDIKLV